MTTVTCSDCKFAVFQDEGYSNWTVEGTTFGCALDKHPDGSFDKFYGEDERLKFANKCPTFEVGQAIDMDVDHENEADLTDEQREVWLMSHTLEDEEKTDGS